MPSSRGGMLFALVCAACTSCAVEPPERQRPSPYMGTGGSGGVGGTAGFGGTGGTGGFLPPELDAGVEDAGTPREPVLIDHCDASLAGALEAGVITQLKAGGAPAGLRLVYPYTETVLPRGLPAPIWMWDGLDTDGMPDTDNDPVSAVYIHIKATYFEYHGCLTPTAAGELAFPEDVWDMAEANTLGQSDPFQVELTVLSTSGVHGPVTQQIVIAQATLKGSIYYNSYSSMLAPVAGNGAVLRLRDGQLEAFASNGGCTGCHSVSANGTRLLTETGDHVTGSTVNGVFQITPTTLPSVMPSRTDAISLAFSAPSPDGSLYLTTARPCDGVSGLCMGPIGTASQDTNAQLYETDTGLMPFGTFIPIGAMTPSFSPSGKWIAFNDIANKSGHALQVMSFDAATRTASQFREVFHDATRYPGWPFILPDDAALVFALGTMTDFSGSGATPYEGQEETVVVPSDLMLTDLDSAQTVLLARAMGFVDQAAADAERTYLPFGIGDLHQCFYPTVSPVAAGGYFWIFFDSVRHHGVRGRSRSLWGAALTVSPDGSYTTDPSHPAFYLPGQEEGTSNHRAFTALDPCREDGASCESGVDCCGGFCTDGVCGSPEVDQPRCSKIDEACTETGDCCGNGNACIAGFCTPIVE